MIQDWLICINLFKVKHGIIDKDIYNINQNRYTFGIAESSNEVFSKYHK